jgi:predicted acyltransferase
VAPSRLAALDAYRGFVMLLMMAEVLRLKRIAQAVPDSVVWNFLAWNQSHVEWVGASLHDLIQPSFSFLVGAALPFSLAARAARGEPPAVMGWHAVRRALLLVLLGVFLRSVNRGATAWTFEDTLSQIGLGYGFLYALAVRPARGTRLAFGAILLGIWAAFAVWPRPGADFDYSRVGVTADWLAAHGQTGFAAHWNKNSNLAWAFDTWWLNLFPREKPFVFNAGGYATLSFVPTLATMLLGLMAGRVLQGAGAPGEKLRWLVRTGAVCLAVGVAWGAMGLCPVVKRIWTPSWVLVSGGACLWLLAAFTAWLPAGRTSRLAFPLLVIGTNSIAAYVMAHLFDAFIAKQLVTHLGPAPFRLFGAAYEPLVQGGAVLLVLWLLLFWLQRRRIFLRL